jgi:hypothetical protein
MTPEVGTLGTPPPPPPPGPVTPYVLRPPRPKRPVKTIRITASTLVLLAAILLAVSMGVSWWGASEEGGGVSGVYSFLPGTSYQATGNFGAGEVTNLATYAGSGLVHVGQLYEAVLGVGLMATLAGFAAMILGYLGALGTFRSRNFLNATLALVLLSFLAAALLPTLVAVLQPGAFNSDGTSFAGAGGGCGASPNPCTSFWGSQSAGAAHVSWGADVGWYLSLAAAALLLVALLQLLMTRRQPYTAAEAMAASA